VLLFVVLALHAVAEHGRGPCAWQRARDNADPVTEARIDEQAASRG